MGAHPGHGTPAPSPPPLEVSVHWPLYSVYPASVVLFWILYLCITPKLTRQCVQQYQDWSDSKRMVWGQNVNYFVHSVLLIICLAGVLISPEADELATAGLQPHLSMVAYCGVCFSLGYMSFTLPWSFNVYFRMKRRDMGTNAGQSMRFHAVARTPTKRLIVVAIIATTPSLSPCTLTLTRPHRAPHCGRCGRACVRAHAIVAMVDAPRSISSGLRPRMTSHSLIVTQVRRPRARAVRGLEPECCAAPADDAARLSRHSPLPQWHCLPDHVRPPPSTPSLIRRPRPALTSPSVALSAQVHGQPHHRLHNPRRRLSSRVRLPE